MQADGHGGKPRVISRFDGTLAPKTARGERLAAAKTAKTGFSQWFLASGGGLFCGKRASIARIEQPFARNASDFVPPDAVQMLFQTQKRENNPMQSRMGPALQRNHFVPRCVRGTRWSVVTA